MIFDPSSYETYSIKQKNFSVLFLSFRTAPKCDCWNASITAPKRRGLHQPYKGLLRAST